MLFLIYAETKMSSSSEEENDPRFRVAPTRKRFRRGSNGNKRNSDTPMLVSETDERADEIIKEMTGKRFSITQLFRRKSKSGSTGDIAQEQETVTTTDKETGNSTEKKTVNSTEKETVNTTEKETMSSAPKLEDSQKAPIETTGESP